MGNKPYTSDQDIDFIIANLFGEQDSVTTKNKTHSNYSEEIIDEAIQQRVLPISLRKRVLYNTVVNL